ncbi:MAG: hypothetical protein HYX92_10170 [Chloroflexi bacterium]|nr:hypothetical protein [Chloroflexota bacterium]
MRESLKVLSIAVGTLALLGLIGAGVVLAADPTPTPTGTSFQNVLLGKVAKILGIDKQKLTDAFTQAWKELLDEAVRNGQMTQQQADWIMQRQQQFIQNGPGFGPPVAGPRFGPGVGGPRFGPWFGGRGSAWQGVPPVASAPPASAQPGDWQGVPPAGAPFSRWSGGPPAGVTPPPGVAPAGAPFGNGWQGGPPAGVVPPFFGQ